ncbi:heme peroxidase [Saitoella coloradoensis]
MFRTAFRSAARSAAIRTSAAGASRRAYAAGQPSKSSNTGALVGIAALVAGGAGYYFYSQNEVAPKLQTAEDATRAVKEHKVDYQKVYKEIAELLASEESEAYEDGSYGPVIVRLAWHASGTYDKETGTGGSNGATMRFAPESDHGANAGLKVARDALEPIKQANPWISYSDLWTLAGTCAIQELSLGNVKVPWRPGRQDKDVAACTPDGRLPDASKEQKHLRGIFYRMGFNDQEIVLLSGAHALGRCHTDRSGFDGPWTFSPTVLTNAYYQLLKSEKWIWKKWDGPKQLIDDGSKSLMMLPTDMALIKDKEFKKWVDIYAADEKRFFEDFGKVFTTLMELGVPFPAEAKPITFDVVNA